MFRSKGKSKMALTRKDFQALADHIRIDCSPTQVRYVVEGQPAEVVAQVIQKHIAHTMADFCKSQNVRFDRERFLKACGVS
jgi:hypothetical protein